MGVVAALTHALANRWFIRIWTDCQSVVTKFRLVTTGLRVLKHSQPHFDLWSKVLAMTEEIGKSRVRLVKVPAHEDELHMTNAFDSWIVQGNRIADRAARQANCLRPSQFWKFWERHSREVLVNQRLGSDIRQHILRVSHRWNQQAVATSSSPPEVSTYGSGKRVPALVWTPQTDLQLRGTTLTKRFGDDFSHTLVTWFNTLWDVQADLQWVSYVQLFVLYQMEFRDAGVGKIDGRWVAFRNLPGATPEQFRYRLLLKWFRLLLQQMLKDTGTKFAIDSGASCSC